MYIIIGALIERISKAAIWFYVPYFCSEALRSFRRMSAAGVLGGCLMRACTFIFLHCALVIAHFPLARSCVTSVVASWTQWHASPLRLYAFSPPSHVGSALDWEVSTKHHVCETCSPASKFFAVCKTKPHAHCLSCGALLSVVHSCDGCKRTFFVYRCRGR